MRLLSRRDASKAPDLETAALRRLSASSEEIVNSDAMIVLENVTKTFRTYSVAYNTLKSFVLHYAAYRPRYESIPRLTVLHDLTVNIDRSEIFCVVGPNGSGKSTLAKLIAGTIHPDSGSVRVRGTVVPFLELGVAFSDELTGRQNAYLNGVLLGLTRKFVRAHIDSIFSFAEVEPFKDTPLKFYSSGMKMRLAFSIAMHVDGDVYVFDEILAVGDANFQAKCLQKFRELLEHEKTIVLITHDLDIVRRLATRVLIMNQGRTKLLESRDAIAAMTAEEISCL